MKLHKVVLFIICGLPFSGKTYLSTKISESFGIQRISYDDLWKEIHQKESRDPNWEEICSIVEARVADELKAGRSVVYDTLNDTVGNREKLKKIAKNNDGEAIVIYADTPLDVIHSRRKENVESGDRHEVSEKNFQGALDRFEVPRPPEVVFRRTPNQPIEAWLVDLERFIKDAYSVSD
ncbi:MAG: ATP-binding protein [bacterium]|nr:ATP-binding protein [bacterium]